MKFDDEIAIIGEWDVDASKLDNIAYYLFLDVWTGIKGNSTPVLEYSTQQNMIKRYNLNKFCYSYFYDKALLLIRKDRLNNIIDKIKDFSEK